MLLAAGAAASWHPILERCPMIAAIVLAAGRSTRMGRPKALLDTAGEPFVRRLARVFSEAGCRPIVAVTAPVTAVAIGAALSGTGANLVVNPLPRSEPIDSLRIGLGAVPAGVDAVLVAPVDAPGFSPDTVRRLIAGFLASGAPIVQPRHAGRGGHPILLARSIWPELEMDGLPEGLRSVLARHTDAVLRVDVDEPGVLMDVDTPEDYRALNHGVR